MVFDVDFIRHGGSTGIVGLWRMIKPRSHCLKGRPQSDATEIGVNMPSASMGLAASGKLARNFPAPSIASISDRYEVFMQVRESTIEQELIEKLSELKYTPRPDIHDRTTLERNFRAKFEG